MEVDILVRLYTCKYKTRHGDSGRLGSIFVDLDFGFCSISDTYSGTFVMFEKSEPKGSNADLMPMSLSGFDRLGFA